MQNIGRNQSEAARKEIEELFGLVKATDKKQRRVYELKPFPSTPSGIKCSNLSPAERTLVLNAIKTYVGDVDDANAATIMTKYTNELENTYVSYSGTTGMTTQNDYVRIEGPSVWIEYSCQHGIILSGTHPHSVWRDKSKDYGGN
jgi:hypothetical protein